MLFKKQKNRFIELIQEVNLSPNLFESRQNNEDEFIISIRNSSFVFKIEFYSGIFYKCYETKFQTKYPVKQVSLGSRELLTLNEIYGEFTKWLKNDAIDYLDEQSIPDLWAELQLSSGSVSDSQDIQNTLFTVDEQRRIAETLGEFEKEVQKRTVLSDEQFNLLHERVEYLIDASKRLGRKDWLAATAGAIIGFTFQVSLTAQTATQIIQLAGEAISWIARTPLLLP